MPTAAMSTMTATPTPPSPTPPPATPAAPALGAISVQDLYRLLEPITAPSNSPRAKFINWGLSYECTPLTVFEPTTEHECELVLELARREGRTVRAAGVGHSPSDLACTSGFMLRTERLNKIIQVSRRQMPLSHSPLPWRSPREMCLRHLPA